MTDDSPDGDSKLKIPKQLPPAPDRQEKEKKPAARPTLIPFEARAKSRPRSGRQPDAKESGPAAQHDPHGPQGSEDERPAGSPAAAPPSAAKLAALASRRLRRILRLRVSLGRALAACLAFALVVAWVFFSIGLAAQRARTLAEIGKQGVEIPVTFQEHLDGALSDLRNGHTEKALTRLTALEREFGSVSSLTYLVALAAMQNGSTELAEAKAVESIKKRERISDALALRAVLETQKKAKGFGDPRIRAEAYLRQAMLADAANPFPRIELATLLRYSKRDAEALALLEGARSRLNPVDSHTVVDVTLALMKLQAISDAEMPSDIDPDKDPASLFSAAYAAMRGGDFARAATILRVGKDRMQPDLFDYLVNDPALRKFHSRPELKEFYP
jgi:hypothetical protein